MRWYLPDRWPFFWHELRRMLGIVHAEGDAMGWKAAFFTIALLGALLLFTRMVKGELYHEKWIFLNLQPWYSLVIGIISPFLTASAISAEREKGRLDSLLTLPISLMELLVQKIVGRAVILLILLLLSLPETSDILFYSENTPITMLLNLFALLSEGILFLALGALISSFFTTTRKAMLATIPIALVIAGLHLASFCLPTPHNAWSHSQIYPLLTITLKIIGIKLMLISLFLTLAMGILTVAASRITRQCRREKEATPEAIPT